MGGGVDTVTEPIRRVREVEVYCNDFGVLCDDVVERAGVRGRYGRWRWHRRIQVVVPCWGDAVGFVPVWRYGRGGVSWELPRGGAEAGEDLDEAVRRELYEETGLRAGVLRWLGPVWSETSFIATPQTVVVAEVLAPEVVRPPSVDAFEAIGAVEWWTGVQVRAAVVDGRLRCGISLAAYVLAASAQVEPIGLQWMDVKGSSDDD